MDQIGPNHYHHHHTSQTPNPAEQLQKCILLIWCRPECKHYFHKESKKGLAGNGSQLEEAAEGQMTRRRDHIEKEYKSMALGNPKSNLLSMCDIDLIFSEQCEHKKIQSFQSNLGSFDMWSLIQLCVRSTAIWPEHDPSDWNWIVSLTPFFLLLCTHKRCTWLTVFVNVGRFMVAAI